MRHGWVTLDQYLAELAEDAYWDREPPPYKPPTDPSGKPLPQFRIAEYGIAPEGRAW